MTKKATSYITIYFCILMFLNCTNRNNQKKVTTTPEISTKEYANYDFPCLWQSNVVIGFGSNGKVRICTSEESKVRKGEYNLASCGEGNYTTIDENTITIKNINNEYGADWFEYEGSYDIYASGGSDTHLYLSKSGNKKYYEGYIPPVNKRRFYFYAVKKGTFDVFR